MAKFKYFYNYEAGFSQFEDMSLVNINSKKTEAIWTNDDGAVITFEGKGFKGNLADDVLTAGQVTSVTVMHPEVGKLVTITDLNIKATKIMDKIEDGAEAMLFFLSKGDDRVIGYGGADLMFGGAGDDVLTGKGGADLFYFRRYDEGGADTAKAGREHDVITDFDTKGEDRDTLYVEVEELTNYKKANDGKDTLITFDDGSTLLLEDVKRYKRWASVWVEPRYQCGPAHLKEVSLSAADLYALRCAVSHNGPASRRSSPIRAAPPMATTSVSRCTAPRAWSRPKTNARSRSKSPMATAIPARRCMISS